jgi:uncharacterized protein (DUF433 family)
MFTPTDLTHVALFRLPLPPGLTVWEYGKVVLTGRRIGLAIVVEDIKAGHTPEQIRADYDLDPQQLDQVLAFIRAYPAEVEEYFREYRAAGERHYQEWLNSDMGRRRFTRAELIRRWKEKFGEPLPDFLQGYAANAALDGDPGSGTVP